MSRLPCAVFTLTFTRTPMAARLVRRALEPELDPMIAVAWIGKEDVLIDIAGKGSANDRKNILVAIVVNIAKSHTVALLQMPKATRGGDILEEIAVGIAKHAIGD